jgi:hypothetical protein
VRPEFISSVFQVTDEGVRETANPWFRRVRPVPPEPVRFDPVPAVDAAGGVRVYLLVEEPQNFTFVYEDAQTARSLLPDVFRAESGRLILGTGVLITGRGDGTDRAESPAPEGGQTASIPVGRDAAPASVVGSDDVAWSDAGTVGSETVSVVESVDDQPQWVADMVGAEQLSVPIVVGSDPVSVHTLAAGMTGHIESLDLPPGNGSRVVVRSFVVDAEVAQEILTGEPVGKPDLLRLVRAADGNSLVSYVTDPDSVPRDAHAGVVRPISDLTHPIRRKRRK